MFAKQTLMHSFTKPALGHKQLQLSSAYNSMEPTLYMWYTWFMWYTNCGQHSYMNVQVHSKLGSHSIIATVWILVQFRFLSQCHSRYRESGTHMHARLSQLTFLAVLSLSYCSPVISLHVPVHVLWTITTSRIVLLSFCMLVSALYIPLPFGIIMTCLSRLS